MDMRDHIKERSELAHTYACDGAYKTALRILTELTDELTTHVVNHVIAPMPGGITILGDYEGQAGTIVQCQNGTRVMVTNKVVGLGDRISVIDLKTGDIVLYGHNVPVVLISAAQA